MGMVLSVGPVSPRLTFVFRGDARERRRLVSSVAAALALHAAVLAWVGGDALAPAPGRPTLTLRLPPASSAPSKPEAVQTKVPPTVSPVRPMVPSLAPAPVSASGRVADDVVTTADSRRVGASEPGAVSEGLAASARQEARRIAREGGRGAARGRAELLAGSGDDRPALPALDRALAREAPGEKRLANGLIRVVTAAGTVYCLQTMADFMQGPGGVRSLVVTCP